jgi:D-alanyl-D-alanine carboxypeptidase
MHHLHFPLCFASLLTVASCSDPDMLGSAPPGQVLADTMAAYAGSRPPLPAAWQSDLQHALDAIVAGGAVPGVSITVDHPNYRPFSAAAGIADLATHQAIEPGDRIRAGSMLKTAVATALLQLVERDKLSLDARLTQLLPPAITSRVAEAENITLRMLLSHTAGVPEPIDDAFHEVVFQNPAKIWTLDDYLTLSAAHPRPFPPGAGWAYSNMDYILAGEILTAASGAPWREAVRRHVLDRAGLTHSSLPRPGHAECVGCARGYESIAGELIDLTEVDPSMAEAAGGCALVTTTTDLVRFLRALLAGELFDRPGTLAIMTSFVDAPLPQEGQTQYGLGLAHFQFGDVELIGHYGGTAGYDGFMLQDTATGAVFAGSANQDPSLAALVPPMVQAVGRLP